MAEILGFEGCAYCYILLTLSHSSRHLLLGIVVACIITTDKHFNRVVRQWSRKHKGLRDIEGVDACDFILCPQYSVYSTFSMMILEKAGNYNIHSS
jgi:hypothetical protein